MGSVVKLIIKVHILWLHSLPEIRH